jgi:DUF1680 family protein
VTAGLAAPVSLVVPSGAAIGALRPLDAGAISVRGGFWAERLKINRERTIPHGFEQLKAAGNLHNLRLAAGAQGSYQALGVMFDGPFPFLDSDVYKWLEAVGWELGRAPDPDLGRTADEVIGLVAAAQRPDGYINSFVQALRPGREYRDLDWGHELYTLGHLIQAAIAWSRATGDTRLLEIAIRGADSVDRELGPTGREAIDGHPEIEMALVELFRTTGEQRYLDLAARFVELRGRGLLGAGRFGAAYWQDHETVRAARSVAGHAVRQLYLDCGAVDVATELGDTELLEAVQDRWHDMIATRSYLTGGVGSRHRDESFGDPFELPPDRAYTETCAAIASVMLAWRLLLATGDPACADVIERTAYNGLLSGLSLDGSRFFYVNVLQRRTHRAAADAGDGRRAAWYPCACCPPNLMRFMSSWEHYLATVGGGGIQVWQYATAGLRGDVAGAPVELEIETDYPWAGKIAVTVAEAPEQPWTLSLRIPAWARSARLQIGSDGPSRDVPAGERSVSETRAWRPGDRLVLDLDTPVRVTEPDPRIDAVRGCLALERGPLVYCIETADVPGGIELEEIEVDGDLQPTTTPRPDLGASAVGLKVPARRRADDDRLEVGAIPYFSWANRSVEAMRVWLPVRPAPEPSRPSA